MAAETRIVVLSLGDATDITSYSGLPYGLAQGLQRVGCEAVFPSVRLNDRLDQGLVSVLGLGYLNRSELRAHPRHTYWRGRRVADTGGILCGVRSVGVNRRLASDIHGISGIVCHGTEIDPGPLDVPIVTLEDQTLAAALRVTSSYPHLQQMTPRRIRFTERQTRRVYANASAYCYMSDFAARSGVDDYGLDPARVHVVGRGLNIEPSQISDRDWAVPRFLWVGKEWKRKGGADLLRAFAQVAEACPDAQLHLVGDHPSALPPGVSGHGMLNPARASERDRLSALFTASTCFVLPSLHEPAGIVHSEAGQAGVGSIGSTSGGAATLIGDGGLLVAPGDIDGVVRAMVTFTDPLRAQRFGARARARAALFSWDRVAGRLVRALGLTAPGSTELPLFL